MPGKRRRKGVLSENPVSNLHSYAKAEYKIVPEVANDGNGSSEAKVEIVTSNLKHEDQASTRTATENILESNSLFQIKTVTLNSQNEDLILSDYESKEETPIVSTPSFTGVRVKSEATAAFTPTKRYFRYFGDIKEKDVQSPKRAALALKMGQEVVSKQRLQLKTLNRKNAALEKKIKRLEERLAELKKSEPVPWW